MKRSWFHGYDEDQKEEFKAIFKSAYPFRQRLKEMLESKSDGMEKLSRSAKLYEHPNWALRQADLVGYNRALDEIINLIQNETDDE